MADGMHCAHRLESAVKKDGVCDADCEDQMRHVMTVHVRKFTAFADVSNATLAAYAEKHPMLANFSYDVQPAAFLTMRVAEAFATFLV